MFLPSFDSLPTEVIGLIIRYVDFADKQELALVSHHFYSVVGVVIYERVKCNLNPRQLEMCLPYVRKCSVHITETNQIALLIRAVDGELNGSKVKLDLSFTPNVIWYDVLTSREVCTRVTSLSVFVRICCKGRSVDPVHMITTATFPQLKNADIQCIHERDTYDVCMENMDFHSFAAMPDYIGPFFSPYIYLKRYKLPLNLNSSGESGQAFDNTIELHLQSLYRTSSLKSEIHLTDKEDYDRYHNKDGEQTWNLPKFTFGNLTALQVHGTTFRSSYLEHFPVLSSLSVYGATLTAEDYQRVKVSSVTALILTECSIENVTEFLDLVKTKETLSNLELENVIFRSNIDLSLIFTLPVRKLGVKFCANSPHLVSESLQEIAYHDSCLSHFKLHIEAVFMDDILIESEDVIKYLPQEKIQTLHVGLRCRTSTDKLDISATFVEELSKFSKLSKLTLDGLMVAAGTDLLDGLSVLENLTSLSIRNCFGIITKKDWSVLAFTRLATLRLDLLSLSVSPLLPPEKSPFEGIDKVLSLKSFELYKEIRDNKKLNITDYLCENAQNLRSLLASRSLQRFHIFAKCNCSDCMATLSQKNYYSEFWHPLPRVRKLFDRFVSVKVWYKHIICNSAVT